MIVSTLPHDLQTSSDVSVSTYISSQQIPYSIFYAMYIQFQNGKTSSETVLQPKWLLERLWSNQKISPGCKSLENVAKWWLFKQALWQIYLPASKRIPHPKFEVPTPNAVHQADLLFMPPDKLPRGCKVFRYTLPVVDVASHYKEAEPLSSKNSDEVAKAFQTIYRHSPLTWPKMLQVDPGCEFMGDVTKEMEKHKTYIRRMRAEIHRDQAIVERFTPWLSACSGTSTL